MTAELKPNIRTLSKQELADYFTGIGEPLYRAGQVYEWLWKKQARSFSEMTNLSKKIREGLDYNFTFNAARINTVQQSSDGTRKFSFLLFDNNIIEGVLIPSGSRVTACISSQVGCNLACSFCATGRLGFKRNLIFDEMYDQVGLINSWSLKENNQALTHIVYMGMGEPLLNYQNVLKSVEIIGSEEGMAMSPQRITVSTVGIAKMIRQLGKDKARFNLAVSLHSANDVKRNEIIPFNKQDSLKDLIEALVYFHRETKKRITVEYIMLKEFNDTIEDAKDLAAFCKNFPVKINLIQYNPVDGVPFADSGRIRTTAFKEFLESKNIVVNLRHSRGLDIDAACGQLAANIKPINS